MLEQGRGQIRLALDESSIAFADLMLGPQRQLPAEQCGDLSVRDNHGNWTYQFCAVIDDRDDGINLVVRGADLIASTGRQILLGRMLGRDYDALFLHHSLLRDSAGEKLSKQHPSEPIARWRDTGQPPEAVIGAAARGLGLQVADLLSLEAGMDAVAKRLAAAFPEQ